ncbi:hypothetical protein D3C76_384540 [compost metagenome]
MDSPSENVLRQDFFVGTNQRWIAIDCEGKEVRRRRTAGVKIPDKYTRGFYKQVMSARMAGKYRSSMDVNEVADYRLTPFHLTAKENALSEYETALKYISLYLQKLFFSISYVMMHNIQMIFLVKNTKTDVL